MIKYLSLALTAGFKIIFASGWINRYSKHPEKYLIEKRFEKAHKLMTDVGHSFHCEFFVNGQENIPQDTNVVFVSNHQSNIDALAYLAVSDKPITFLAKEETVSFPYVGKIVKALDGVFIDRHDFHQEVKAMISLENNLENNPKQSVFIFPEGTRSRDISHTVIDFKPGALKPAYNASKPIVPVAIYGAFRVIDKKLRMKHFPIQIAYLKPHYPEEYKKLSTIEMAKIIQKEVSEKVDELRRNDKVLCQENKILRLKNSVDISGI
jgi:1-acyl-sn-glycerol-3-phosphate acyltransferase